MSPANHIVTHKYDSTRSAGFGIRLPRAVYAQLFKRNNTLRVGTLGDENDAARVADGRVRFHLLAEKRRRQRLDGVKIHGRCVPAHHSTEVVYVVCV